MNKVRRSIIKCFLWKILAKFSFYSFEPPYSHFKEEFLWEKEYPPKIRRDVDLEIDIKEWAKENNIKYCITSINDVSEVVANESGLLFPYTLHFFSKKEEMLYILTWGK